MMHHAGRHFLQIPGPTNVPLGVLAAIARPTIDHRGPEFAALTHGVLEDLKPIFGTTNPVVVFPSSGTGAWEAALANTLSPGDKVLMYCTGWFASLWCKLVARLGLAPELIEGDWRTGVRADLIEQRLRRDPNHEIRAVAVVHNETSTGVLSNILAVRAAIDSAAHPALLMVDTISSLASAEYCHDDWGVDVTVAGSQKGLMLPPGLAFNAVSEKARAASMRAGIARSYWDWQEMLAANANGFFPYTPATNLIFGLRASVDLLRREGMKNVFTRHSRAAAAVRECVEHWGLEVNCLEPSEHSPSLTAVRLPEGYAADRLRSVILERFNVSLGNGLGRLSGVVFRIGHLGDFNDAALIGTLASIEMGLHLNGVPVRKGGVLTAMEILTER